jgi:uncharacterized protein (UPF0332 family)
MRQDRQLLLLAEGLLGRCPSSSGHDSMAWRRCVSTAYYAVFHALAGCCADVVLPEADKLSDEYERVYRALDHGPLRTAFANKPLKDLPKLNEIGGHVVRLQSERHRADYFPDRKLFTQYQCAELIHTARVVVELLDSLTQQERRTLAVSLLFRNRLA